MISITLHGLPSVYESFIDVIQFQLGSTTIDELHGLLLSREIQLTNRKKSFSSVPIQAFNSSVGIIPTPTGDSGSQAFFTQSGSNFNSFGNQNRGNFSNPMNFQNCGNQRYNQGFQGNQRFNRGN